MLEEAVKASEVRANFSMVVDEVIHNAPKVVTRTRDHFIMMNIEHMASLVSEIGFHVSVTQDEGGSYIAVLAEIEDLLATSDHVEGVITVLANDLIEYAKEYLHENFSIYFHAPNRKKHFPYVLKVMMQNSIEEVIQLFHVQH